MSYQLKTKDFEGPLELLLELIEGRKLSINEVSLGLVTEDYFSYINAVKENPGNNYHEDIASFLVVAATLILIKSRSLLPGFWISEEETSDIKELENRLRAYKMVKERAAELGALAKNRQELFTRSAFISNEPSFSPPQGGFDLQAMLVILKEALVAIPQTIELPQKTVKKIVSIETMIKELENRIEQGMVKTFNDFVHKKKEKLDVVVSFLAMLELIKIGVIAVRQSSAFDAIHIEHESRKSS